MLGSLLKDIGYGIRTIKKNPGFALVTVLTLSLAIGANTAIFSVVNAVLLRPLNYEDPDELVLVWTTNKDRQGSRLSNSPHDFADWKRRSSVFEDIAIFTSRRGNLTGLDRPESVRYTLVSPEYFNVLGSKPELGRAFVQREMRPGEDNVAVLSYAFWQQRFGGDRGVLGKTLVLNDQSLQVVGVMPPDTGIFSETTQLWKPFGISMDPSEDRTTYWVLSIARLKDGVSMQQAQSEMDTIMEELGKIYPESNGNLGALLQSLNEVAVGSIRPALLILWGSVGLVLLIACVNVAHLLLGRAIARRKEIAIRASLGAGRGRIVRQLLTESLVLSFTGGLLGLLLAYLGVGLLTSLGEGQVPRIGEVDIDGAVLFFALFLSFASGIIFGILPAMRSNGGNLSETMNETGRRSSGGGGNRWRMALVVTEMGLALMVLIGAGLLIRSFTLVLQEDLGFSPENLLALRLEPPFASLSNKLSPEEFNNLRNAEHERMTQFYENLLERTERLPGVVSASAVNSKPMSGGGWGIKLSIQGRPVIPFPDRPTTRAGSAMPGYFKTVGIPILRGRAFTVQDTSSAPLVAVVNQSMAKAFWEGEDPIGQQFTSSDPTSPRARWFTIVGVVGNVPFSRIESGPRPMVYAPFAQARFGRDWAMDVVVRTEDDPLLLAEAVREQVYGLDKDLPVQQVGTLEQTIDNSTAGRRFNVLLMAVLAVVALSLSLVGIYGVISYMVSQRTHEIGIRLALGAEKASILKMIVGRGLLLIGMCVVLGMIGAFFLTRYLQSLLYEVTATDPLTFIAVPLLMVLVALLACYIPARRATRIDPIDALRYE